jgi:hypothetical protein
MRRRRVTRRDDDGSVIELAFRPKSGFIQTLRNLWNGYRDEKFMFLYFKRRRIIGQNYISDRRRVYKFNPKR